MLTHKSGSALELVREFADLNQSLVKKESEVQELKKNITKLERAIIDQFGNLGVQNVKLVDGRTISFRTDYFYNLTAATKAKAFSALKAHQSTAFLVTREDAVNASRLSGFCREVCKNAEILWSVPALEAADLPVELAELITCSTKESIRVTKT